MQWTLAFEQGNYRRGQISLVSHCSITGDSAGYGIAVQQGPYIVTSVPVDAFASKGWVAAYRV